MTPYTTFGSGQVPVLGRIFPAPRAAKVPEVIFLFWVVKILTTAGGEATSDYFQKLGNIRGGAAEVGFFLFGLVAQFATRRYQAIAYWFLAFAIAIFGTGVSDFLHLDVHIPYLGTTILWAVVLVGIFSTWYVAEGTLSIHSITTQRREAFYWATVFATFALAPPSATTPPSPLGSAIWPQASCSGGHPDTRLAWWKFTSTPSSPSGAPMW